MTSTLRGRGLGSRADANTDRLCEWDSDKGGGMVQKSQIYADVMYVNGPTRTKGGRRQRLFSNEIRKGNGRREGGG